ncbi:MAG: helix-turn-helix transcriptional regulator [Ruminococcaceae bacterium]|nr:helix-turn-helix transcriptional regulator [Oscillospiraceae bacterium]
MLSEEQLRKNFALRLAAYRKNAGLTQTQLAEKLNYSDKSISKWERGDGLPDFYIVLTLAELFSVSVEDLIGEGPIRRPLLTRNKAVTTLLSMGLPWLLAVVLFTLSNIFLPLLPSWKLFIYALPVTAIIAIVFTKMWWGKIPNFLAVSSLVWTVPTCLVITLSLNNIAFVYTISAVLQILIILWFLRKKQ